MKLLTAEIIRRFKSTKRGSWADPNDRPVIVKFFDPCGRGTWYAVEAEPGDDGDWICYGWCTSPLGEDCDEWGYFSVAELASVRNRLGLGIERDMWLPKGATVGQIRKVRA